jgi:two-component system nitrogen regulation response regulator NtrX
MSPGPSEAEHSSANQSPRRRFMGTSRAACKVRDQIELAARVDAPVLIRGESGVGKELVAHEIHLRSRRRNRRFLTLNCAAIPDTLLEAELFGHEAGAYTDAREARRGAFELSHRGTLFLDEVGDFALSAQPKLLRALETGEMSRVGGESSSCFDFRVVSATNHDLRKMCRSKQFRSDLYYRLCVLEIYVPPLRERIEDLPLLSSYFSRQLAEKMGCEAPGLSRGAQELLSSYSWPGNVRQLKNLVERAMAMYPDAPLDPTCFALDPESGTHAISTLLTKDWKSAREGFERVYARQLLDRHKGTVTNAARAAGLAPASLYRMLRRLGLPPGRKSR